MGMYWCKIGPDPIVTDIYPHLAVPLFVEMQIETEQQLSAASVQAVISHLNLPVENAGRAGVKLQLTR